MSWYNSPWIGAFGTIIGAVIGGLFAWFARRIKPNLVTCREAEIGSLVRISKMVRKRISVTFDGQTIHDLAAVDFEINNEGADPIENAEIAFSAPEGTKILDMDVEPKPTDLKWDKTIAPQKATLKISCLNPSGAHGHLFKVNLVCDGVVEELKVSGHGKGWSIRMVRLPSTRTMSLRTYFVWGCIIMQIPIFIFYANTMEPLFGIPPSPFLLKRFLIVSPFLLLTFVLALVYYYWVVRPRYRRS